MDYAFIVNPAAGTGFAVKAMEGIEAKLQERQIAYRILYTERPGHATELAAALAAPAQAADVAIVAQSVGSDDAIDAAVRERVNAIKKQNLALQDAREQMEDNGQKLVIRMNNAWAAVETSHKKLVIAHEAIAQAEENLRLNKDYYRVGTIRMSDLLLAEQQYQAACDRYTDAYAAMQTKILEYRQATGR